MCHVAAFARRAEGQLDGAATHLSRIGVYGGQLDTVVGGERDIVGDRDEDVARDLLAFALKAVDDRDGLHVIVGRDRSGLAADADVLEAAAVQRLGEAEAATLARLLEEKRADKRHAAVAELEK